MDEGLKKSMMNEIDNPWEFINRAHKKYKEEFRKTAKIGTPPKVDTVMEEMFIAEKGKKEL